MLAYPESFQFGPAADRTELPVSFTQFPRTPHYYNGHPCPAFYCAENCLWDRERTAIGLEVPTKNGAGPNRSQSAYEHALRTRSCIAFRAFTTPVVKAFLYPSMGDAIRTISPTIQQEEICENQEGLGVSVRNTLPIKLSSTEAPSQAMCIRSWGQSLDQY